ncbi:MAG: DUF262 domain-containing protein [Verrucomicrobia bacterium]|nr:DUF262 domain-containing protein [Verrucomicrobiota bacterium]
MIITPKSLSITQLLSAEGEQYVVPAYQRRYSWHDKQLGELLDDVSLLEGSDTHLLGSIVCLTGYHKAGINELELVDGQQRLTTICILLHCIADRLKKDGETSAAHDVYQLLHARALGEAPVKKILLDSLDADQFDEHLCGKIPVQPDNQNLALAFSTFRKWINDQKLTDLASFLYRLKNQCIVIRLDVSDAKDAFKLFETINNRGLKLSPTDIIKNFILGNAARFGPGPLALARKKWAELLRHLDGIGIESFFRNFLCARLKRRITISYVIPNFKMVFMRQVTEASQLSDRHWYFDEPIADEAEESTDEIIHNGDEPKTAVPENMPQLSFADFLEQLVIGAKTYGEIVKAKTGLPAVDRHLRNLRMIKSLQTYGFLMALRVGGCSDEDFAQVLKLTEAFLIRRHVCRERSNENETLFARLCSVDALDPLKEVTEEFRRMSPTDERFRHEFAAFDFSAGLIDRARYCLEQFELSKQGNYSELLIAGPDAVHIEHIIPQKIKTKKAKDEFGDWVSYLGNNSETKHSHFVSRIGNLTLFAGTLNQGASNNPFGRKKSAYLNSAIKLTNLLPSEFPEFRFDQVEERSADFAEKAVEIWPIP